MVRVQDEDAIHGLGQGRADLGLFTGVAEHHVQEVLCVTQVVARVHERLAQRVLVAHGRDGGHLGDQAVRGDLTVLGIIDVQRVVVEGRQRANYATHDGHRMGIAAETVEEVANLLMHHGVILHGADELIALFCGGQFAVQQGVTHFQVVGLAGQFLDGVAAMQQLAHFTINKGDLGFTGGGGGEARVEGKDTVGYQFGHVNNIAAQGRGVDRQVQVLTIYLESGFLLGHGNLSIGGRGNVPQGKEGPPKRGGR